MDVVVVDVSSCKRYIGCIEFIPSHSCDGSANIGIPHSHLINACG